MKIKKRSTITSIAVWLLPGLTWLATALSSSAQTDIIGNWQNNSGDGWVDNGNLLSITNSANTNKYQFVSAAVTGYAQSLEINQSGFGSNLRIDLAAIPGGKAAFLANHLLSFTFSVPSAAASGSTAGYSQIYSFAFNSAGGYTNVPWTAWTGNSGNQPNFYFYAGASARSVTVTWDYSGLLTNSAVTNSSYLQLTFTSNNGGGAPTNIFMNNVALSGFQNPEIVIDQFNPTNNPYVGTNIYANGNITNVYANWFGSAFDSVVWDGTSDANANPNSGSLEITATYGTAGGDQFVVMDKGPGFSFAGINPPITNAYSLLTFECDVRYDPSSPTWIVGGGTNYGHLEFGVVPPYNPLDVIGSVNVSTTNTGWVHVVIPLNPTLDTNLLSIQGIFVKQDGASYGNLQGTTILWVDNIVLTYTNAPPVIVPPTLSVASASPGLRVFAGDTANIYSREEVATVDQSQSWIGGGYPVTYSFTLLSYPAGINQTHIFLVPVNSTPGANPYGYNGVDYTATNAVWFTLNPGPTAGSVVASVVWKTNQPSFNPTNSDCTFTNATAIGTWTLSFTGPGGGTVMPPGGPSHSFTIADPSVATDFANPLVAYFGLQPNSAAAEGQHEDWASIAVTGVSGAQENEDFTQENTRDITASGYWRNMSATTNSLALVPTNALPAYWVSWTLPAVNFGLGTATSITGSPNTPYPWVLPEYYNSYNDGNQLPGLGTEGSMMWVLVPWNCLPTSNGAAGGPLSPNAFFELFNPPLAN